MIGKNVVINWWENLWAEVVKLVLDDSGSREPKFFGSFSTSLTYKNVSLQASFVYSLGTKNSFI